jgi:alpha-aminoadipic semialdehyde synthase
MLGRRLHYNTIKRNSSHTAPIRCLVTLGIRREDPKRVWERRVPLVPSAIAELVGTAKGNVHVQVESCSRRCYGDDDYRHAGARVVPQLTGGEDIVMGIKEPPVEEVRRLRNSEKRQRTWMVFSHTHKGQVSGSMHLGKSLN